MRCVFSASSNGQTLGVTARNPSGGAEPKHVDGASAGTGWRAVVQVVRGPAQTLVNDLVTTFFPADCRACSGPLEHASFIPLCRACIERITINVRPGCERCGEALNFDLDLEDVRFASLLAEGFLCSTCRMAAPPFTQAVSFATYENELRILIQLLKFEHQRGVARLLGGRMGEAILRLHGHAAAELLVVAVPLFRARERQRGYNQSVLLAAAAMRWVKRVQPAWKLVAAHATLVRKRHTESQFTLSAKGRRRNLRGAFMVRRDVRGREVLLIDDIFTSGATTRECARVLIEAGASKVWVATLARAQKPYVQRQQEDPNEYVAAWDLPVSTTLEVARPNEG